MANLDTQCKSFNIVINMPFKFESCDDFEKVLVKFDDELSRQSMFYARIKHDCDLDNLGHHKTNHYHYVITCATRKRVSTMLYFIADSLGYSTTDELNTISVVKCDSVPLSIQYLIHKNNKDKFQYDIANIVTNYTPNELDDYMSQDNKEITTRYLYDLIMQGRTDVEIMFIIGVGRYHLFKGAITDLRYAISRTPNSVESFVNSIDK